MSEFVRRALRDLSGNQFKLWIAIVEYRQLNGFDAFAQATGIELSTCKALLPTLVQQGFLARDTSRRPHRFSLAQQLQLRFDDSLPKVGKTHSEVGKTYFGDPPKVGFSDSLYLMPEAGINQSESESKIDSNESGKNLLWEPDNRVQWKATSEDFARQSMQRVGDRSSSMGFHCSLWNHARRVDAICKTRLVDALWNLVSQIEQERTETGLKMGCKFNSRADQLFSSMGFPRGRAIQKPEVTNDPTLLDFRDEPDRANSNPTEQCSPTGNGQRPQRDPAAAATANRARDLAARAAG